MFEVELYGTISVYVTADNERQALKAARNYAKENEKSIKLSGSYSIEELK